MDEFDDSLYKFTGSSDLPEIAKSVLQQVWATLAEIALLFLLACRIYRRKSEELEPGTTPTAIEFCPD